MIYDYQQAGIEWLASRRYGLLADQQGLGKTLQAIAAADRCGSARVLVLAPPVVLYNWAREIRQWGTTGSGVQILACGADRWDGRSRWVIAPHSLVPVETFARHLADVAAGATVILDESHFFRHAEAARTRHFYGLAPKGGDGPSIVRRAARVWLLSGTPAPNNPCELWPMLRTLATLPPNARAFAAFRDRYCHWAPTDHGWRFLGTREEHAAELGAVLGAFLLRRLKADVLPSLPPLRVVQQELVPCSSISTAEIHEAEAELSLDVEPETSPHLATWRRLVGVAKARPVAELAALELDSGLPALVIAVHHRQVAAILAQQLADYGVVTITGDRTAAERAAAVDAFQRGDARVAVCQIVAGGTGITLTRAPELWFAERSWSPGENAQIRDRVHRLGQGAPVLIRELFLAGTLDEAMARVIERKLGALGSLGLSEK